MFYPNTDLINGYIKNTKNIVLTSFPIGYVTDFVKIISTTSTSTLKVIDATVPSGVIGTGARIQLNMYKVLDPYLYATTSRFINSSASSTKTFYEITSYYWNLLVYISVVFYILLRIFGSHMIPDFMRTNQFGSNGALSDSGDEAYRLKEWLYKNKK